MEGRPAREARARFGEVAEVGPRPTIHTLTTLLMNVQYKFCSPFRGSFRSLNRLLKLAKQSSFNTRSDDRKFISVANLSRRILRKMIFARIRNTPAIKGAAHFHTNSPHNQAPITSRTLR